MAQPHNPTWPQWVSDVMYPDDRATAARRAGLNRSTINRWFTDGVIPEPAGAVMFARAYGASPVQALVTMGLLHEDEVDLAVADAPAALRAATDDALLAEVKARMNRTSDGHVEHLRGHLGADDLAAIDADLAVNPPPATEPGQTHPNHRLTCADE